MSSAVASQTCVENLKMNIVLEPMAESMPDITGNTPIKLELPQKHSVDDVPVFDPNGASFDCVSLISDQDDSLLHKRSPIIKVILFSDKHAVSSGWG